MYSTPKFLTKAIVIDVLREFPFPIPYTIDDFNTSRDISIILPNCIIELDEGLDSEIFADMIYNDMRFKYLELLFFYGTIVRLKSNFKPAIFNMESSYGASETTVKFELRKIFLGMQTVLADCLNGDFSLYIRFLVEKAQIGLQNSITMSDYLQRQFVQIFNEFDWQESYSLRVYEQDFIVEFSQSSLAFCISSGFLVSLQIQDKSLPKDRRQYMDWATPAYYEYILQLTKENKSFVLPNTELNLHWGQPEERAKSMFRSLCVIIRGSLMDCIKGDFSLYYSSR